MANSITHSDLPFPVRNARFSMLVPFTDSTGAPLDPTTPDTEVSKDAAAFADAAEEVSAISGSNGVAQITFTGAETNCAALAVAFKSANAATTLATIYPRRLAVLSTGTAQAGAATTITLASGAPAYDLTGCIVRTTGGTGGGGTGGANNQARLITGYNPTTKVATVATWETNPSSDTTYDVLMTETFVNANAASINGGVVSVSAGTVDADVVSISGDTNSADNLGAAYANGLPFIQGQVNVGATATTTSFETDTAAFTSKADDFFNNALITFLSGALQGITCRVTDFVNSTNVFTVSTLPSAPANNDWFILIGRQTA